MRSYRDGQQSVGRDGQQSVGFGEKTNINRRPVFRSSAVFQVVETKQVSTEINFLGYWLLKRNIREVDMVVSLRDAGGNLLQLKQETISEVKIFKIDVGDWLDELGRASNDEFIGSIELEVFSSQDLYFRYPAFVLVYYGEDFSTSVHTSGRIYNDIADQAENSQALVPETGFDVWAAKGCDPFFAFTNGAVANPNGIIDIRLLGGPKVVEDSIELGKISAFETRFVMLKDYIDLETLLGGQKGAISLRHNFEGFFPRFVAGNFEDNQGAMSITHTYYDSTELDSDDVYIETPPDNLYHSSILLPFFSQKGIYSQLVLYPCSSPSSFALHFLYIDRNGKLLRDVMVDEKIVNSGNLYITFDFSDIALSNNIQLEQIACVKLVVEFSGKIPSRLKMGLNVGQKHLKHQLPCNICFALEIGDERKLGKPSAFRWLPILNKGNSILVITNSGPSRSYERNAEVKLSFYREGDKECLARNITLGPDQTHAIELRNDQELREFLGAGIGWTTVHANNGSVNSWYFDLGKGGIVAGDHGF